ncbi:MAG TPA: potassium/proton antiporter [Treponemataceae bacterium]|nr:potassium/proton antiporter [Treponemataceae bacterium]
MILIFSLLIIVSMISTKLSSKMGIPLLIGFILIGIIAGSDVLNLLYFDNALMTKQITDILLIFIIFEGGFRVTRKNFHKTAGPSLTLATLGVMLTALALGLFIYFVLKLDFLTSFLIASIISSTDAAAVFMVTKENPINPKLATTINVESAANDPMAILLTVTFIQLLTEGIKSPVTIVISLTWQFLGGVAIGYLVHIVTIFVFNKFNSDNRGNYNVLIIGQILFCYGLAVLCKANGIIAVFFMGYWLGNANYAAKQGVSNFLESIASMCNVGLFLILGLLSFPSRFIHIWKEGVIVVLVLIFIARPIAVFLCTIPFKYNFKEKLFIIWGGIKGAVPIVLATYPAAYGLDENGYIFDIIFFAVFISCLLQGSTLGLLSKAFNFTIPKRQTTPYVVELHSTQETDVEMFEIHIDDDAQSINKKISKLDLGQDVLISSIIRDGKIVLPKGNVCIKAQDILFILTSTEKIDEINAILNN